jgi:ATP-dependent RNA helicase DDX41
VILFFVLEIFVIHTLMIDEPQVKRRRIERSPSPTYKLDDQDESYEPYVPVAQRRQEKLRKLASRGLNADREQLRKQRELDAQEDELREEEKQRERERREKTLLVEAQEVHSRKAAEGMLLVALEYLSA